MAEHGQNSCSIQEEPGPTSELSLIGDVEFTLREANAT